MVTVFPGRSPRMRTIRLPMTPLRQRMLEDMQLRRSFYAMRSPVVSLGDDTPTLYPTLADDERRQVEADRRTTDAFRLRRAHIVLASARGLSLTPIAQLVSCAVQTVRNLIHAFHAQGVAGLARQAHRPQTVAPV